MIERDEALASIIDYTTKYDAKLFVGNGNNARSTSTMSTLKNVFYMLGSMGNCACIAAGYSLTSDDTVIAVEGDGNALMGLSGLPTIINAVKGKRFVHIVLDNGVYETTGSQMTLSKNTNFSAIAHSVGYSQVMQIETQNDLSAALESIKTTSAPIYLHIMTKKTTIPQHGRVPFHPVQIKQRFMKALQHEKEML